MTAPLLYVLMRIVLEMSQCILQGDLFDLLKKFKIMFHSIHTNSHNFALPSASPVGLCSLLGSDGMCSQSGIPHRIKLVPDKNRKLGFTTPHPEGEKGFNQDVIFLFKPNDRSFLSPDPFQKYPGSQAEPGSSITTILNTNT